MNHHGGLTVLQRSNTHNNEFQKATYHISSVYNMYVFTHTQLLYAYTHVNNILKCIFTNITCIHSHVYTQEFVVKHC